MADRRPIPTNREPAVAIYDGQALLGMIFDDRAGSIATSADRMPLGLFKNWREAQSAIFEARRLGLLNEEVAP